MADSDAEVMAEIREYGPCTVTEIVADTALSERTVRVALARLENAGLVVSDGYQRRARVYLPAQEGDE